MSETTRATVQPITLGELIALLEERPGEQSVVFDFGYFKPTDLDSYRGYYDHLALGYSEDGAITVGVLLAACRKAVGAKYEGYKGGTFRMTTGTPVWVANYGQSPSTAITGLASCEYVTVIATGYCEDWEGGMARARSILAAAGVIR